MKLDKLGEKFFENFWGDALQTRTFLARAGLKTARLVVAVLRDVREGGFGPRAASLAYTTLVTFVPLLAITFSVLKGFGVHDALEPSLRAWLAPLGDEAGDISRRIIGFVENIKVGVLGAIGIAFLLFGVISMMKKLEDAFNDIWRVARARSFMRRIRDYMVVLLLAPLSLFLSVAMTTSLKHADFAWQWLSLDLVDGAMERVFSIVPWILFMLAFAALYIFMPNTRVKAVPGLVAGAVTAVIWKVLGKLFGIFVAGSASYAAIYSVFATLILFMIWVYAGWMVVLVGAAVSYYLQNPSNQSLSRSIKNLSLRVKEKIALQVCAEVGREFYKQQHGLSLAELSSRLKMPALAVFDVVEDLAKQGVLAATGTKVRQYIPGRPFDTTSINDMLLAIRSADETGVLRAQKIHASPAVNAAVKIAEKAMDKELGKFTLKQLATGSIPS